MKMYQNIFIVLVGIILSVEKYFTGQYGRLRDVVQVPDVSFYILTNNRDGRGNPKLDDDKTLRLFFQ